MTADKKNIACLRAELNLNSEILNGQKFPKKVLTKKWTQFYFFDSDWVFEPNFCETVKALVEKEQSTCVCISQLNHIEGATNGRKDFFINAETTTSEYSSLLYSNSQIAESWLVNMDRFGCTSDKGKWIIYSERSNEMALIAFEDDKVADELLPLIEYFKALPIEAAIRAQYSYGFSDAALSQEWRNALILHYKAQK